MLKSYLNQQERKDMIYFTSFLGFIEDKFIGGWCKKDTTLTKEEKKAIRTAETLLYKSLDSILTRLGKDFAKRLYADIKDSDVFVMPKLRAQKAKEEFLKQGDIVGCDLNDLYGLAEIALLKCNNCNEHNYEECKLRGYLLDINLPAYNEFASNKCQYLPDGEVKYSI